MVLVDSSVWIEAARRGGSMDVKCGLEGLLEEFQAGLCGLVWMEVLGGARGTERSRMRSYFAVLPRLPTEEAAWNEASLAAATLRDHGLTIPWSDVLVATLALMQGIRVYAHDGHFNRMAPVLGLQLYEPGYGGRYVRD
jgi:predicted nucleic acid-binding protein